MNKKVMPIINGVFFVLLGVTLIGPWRDYTIVVQGKEYEQRCPVWVGWSLTQLHVFEAKA